MMIATRRSFCARTLALVAVLAVSVCLAGEAFAQHNLIYINSNITADKQNSVIALINDGFGNLTPVSGSPFLTGGTGVGANPNPQIDFQWDSDGEVVINQAGTLLFAVNGHSDDISAFRITATGALISVDGSPFASGGKQPASIAYKDNALGQNISMMVVANKDSDPLDQTGTPSYSTFKVTSHGVLSQYSSLALPAGVSPAQVIIQPDSNNFFGVEFMASQIASYKLNRIGQMTPVSAIATSGAVVGSVLHPTVKALYATIPPSHAVGVFTWNASGNLFHLNDVADPGLAVCWAAVNAAGTRLYVSETTSGSLTVYDLTNTKLPVQLQHLFVKGAGALPEHMKLDPTGKFLYVLDRTGVLHLFDVAADGTIAENYSPYNLGLPANTVPLGVAVLSK
jgi:6-phosphogluconolactonase (cycloisomerase 2 family)